VRDAGLAPKGGAASAAARLYLPLAYVSASHLPAEWNGLKFMDAGGRTWDRVESDRLRVAFFGGLGAEAGRRGRVGREEWRRAYLERLAAVVPRAAAPLRLLVDSGNGTAGLAAPELLRRLGFDVTSLYEEPDGRMPNRQSDLTEEALRGAAAAMPGHDLGMAFDGDADRVVFLDASGAAVDPERFAFVMLRELAGAGGGPVVASVACGRTIEDLAARFGLALRRVPVGAPYLVGECARSNAVFGMEASSHMVVPRVAPYDDAVGVAAYAAWALSRAAAEGRTLADLLAEVPARARRRAAIAVPDAAKAAAVERLKARAEAAGYRAEEADGLCVRRGDAWVLVRASGTEPALRLYVEAGDGAAAASLERLFRGWIAEAVAETAR
jgi:phosphomannomutase